MGIKLVAASLVTLWVVIGVAIHFKPDCNCPTTPLDKVGMFLCGAIVAVTALLCFLTLIA